MTIDRIDLSEEHPIARRGQREKLELANLIVPVLATLGVALIGYLSGLAIEQRKADLSQVSSVQQERLRLYDSIGTPLNQIFSYFLYVGKWKQYSEQDIIAKERAIDEIVNTYQPIFPQKFIDDYQSLRVELFAPYQGWGRDGSLRTSYEHRPRVNDKTLFTGEDRRTQICSKYRALLGELAVDLGLIDLSTTDQLTTIGGPCPKDPAGT